MMPPSSDHGRLPAPNPAVICQPLAEGAVLFDPASEVYYGLNEPGVLIWELLASAVEDLDALAAGLVARYPDVPVSVLRDDAAELIESLVAQGLLIARPSALTEAA